MPIPPIFLLFYSFTFLLLKALLHNVLLSVYDVNALVESVEGAVGIVGSAHECAADGVDAYWARSGGCVDGDDRRWVLVVVVAERHVLHVAPDVTLQTRIVDERVAVLLHAVGSVVTVHLLLAHGVLLSSLQQQVERPLLVSRIGVAGEHRARPTAYLALVACSHVEIDAREVALVHIVRLEHCARVAGSC